jgi:hypothetical protein
LAITAKISVANSFQQRNASTTRLLRGAVMVAPALQPLDCRRYAHLKTFRRLAPRRARPVRDPLRLLVHRCVGDVRDASQRLKCSAGPFRVPQIDRRKLNILATGQLGFAA